MRQASECDVATDDDDDGDDDDSAALFLGRRVEMPLPRRHVLCQLPVRSLAFRLESAFRITLMAGVPPLSFFAIFGDRASIECLLWNKGPGYMPGRRARCKAPKSRSP